MFEPKFSLYGLYRRIVLSHDDRSRPRSFKYKCILANTIDNRQLSLENPILQRCPNTRQLAYNLSKTKFQIPFSTSSILIQKKLLSKLVKLK